MARVSYSASQISDAINALANDNDNDDQLSSCSSTAFDELNATNESFQQIGGQQQQADDEHCQLPSQRLRKSSLYEMPDTTVSMLDLSELYRPEEHNGKTFDEFRKYSDTEKDPIQKRVRQTYYTMHKMQTVESVRQRIEKWTKFNHAELTIMDALIKLNGLIDASDPDSNLPNIVHAFQTAERIRKVHPNDDWFHLVGLIHDLGKIIALYGEEQWAVVGDTFVVGCAFADSIVYRERSFDENPDLRDARYNSKYGIYRPNCGLDSVLFSWGHDEYMYRVLKNHPRCTLPEVGLKIIKLHSFYPWHTGKDYYHLCTEADLQLLPIITEFNKFDLYTKSECEPNIEQLLPYYQSLIDKYIPGKVKF